MSSEAVRNVANLIQNGHAKRITLLTGAGASVASGIPDFRSPGGMYSTLKPELLTASEEDRQEMRDDPVMVVDKELFLRNALPYHEHTLASISGDTSVNLHSSKEVRRPFIIGSAAGQWKPTIAQMFTRLLHDNGLLMRLYTQNIDGLDFDVGLPAEKIVCVHGSIRQTMCESCHADPYGGEYDAYVADVKTQIKDIYNIDVSAPLESKPIACRNCGALSVKPTTVLYGGALPHQFFTQSARDFGSKGVLGFLGEGVQSNDPNLLSDMMFVIGSSLTVYPAAALPDSLVNGRPRVLVNRDDAGDFDYVNRDFWLRGDIDETLLELIVEIGWLDQLVALKEGLCEASQQRVDAALALKSGAGASRDGVKGGTKV